jgi:hypothetical protein
MKRMMPFDVAMLNGDLEAIELQVHECESTKQHTKMVKVCFLAIEHHHAHVLKWALSQPFFLPTPGECMRFFRSVIAYDDLPMFLILIEFVANPDMNKLLVHVMEMGSVECARCLFQRGHLPKRVIPQRFTRNRKAMMDLYKEFDVPNDNLYV